MDRKIPVELVPPSAMPFFEDALAARDLVSMFHPGVTVTAADDNEVGGVTLVASRDGKTLVVLRPAVFRPRHWHVELANDDIVEPDPDETWADTFDRALRELT